MMQLRLFERSFYCHNCRQWVMRVQKTRRFWLCDECWKRIVPAWTWERGAETAAERAQVSAYWDWYGEMERRYPARGRGRGGLRAARTMSAWDTDNFWPYCECGREREQFRYSRAEHNSLFGGPRMPFCPVCEAKRGVETTMRMVGVHPDWDDEAWLDLLYQAMPAAFALGVLPD